MGRRSIDIPAYRGDGVSVANSGVDLGKGSPIVRASAVGAVTLEVLSACSTPTPGPATETPQLPVVVRTPTSEAVATVTPVPPTPEVVAPDQVVDVSLIGGQQEVVEYGSYGGNTYNYDFQNKTVVAPAGIEMAESTRVSFNQTAETLISVLGQPADVVAVKTSGQLGNKSRNVALAFDVEGNSESMYWPTAFGENSSSPDWSFSTPNVTSKDVTYNKIPLPPGVKHNQITVRFILGGPVENKIVEATASDGTVWVFDWKKGEFISMIDMPQGELAAPIIDNYGKKFAEVFPEQGNDYSPEAISERMKSAEPQIYTAADGSSFKVLADPLTGQHLFIRTIDSQTKEWGEWREMTSRAVMEVGVKPGDTFKYFGAQFSNPFEVNKSPRVDEVISLEFNGAHLNDGSWHVVEQQEGHPNFSYVVDAADDAKEKNIPFIMGGVLLDPRGDFSYTYLKNMWDIAPEDLSKIIDEHIRAEMATLIGKVDAMTVVNESRPKGQITPEGKPEDPYNAIIGEQYIEAAFQAARDATKDSVPPIALIYNDGYNYHPANDYTNGSNNTARTMEVVNRLKSQGLIDGVGVQMHIRASEPPNMAKIIKTFQNYGIPVYVTEFEVDVSDIPGSPAEKEQVRLKLRQEIIKAMLDSGVVVSLSHWFALDTEDGDKGQLLDSSLQPTADLFAEREALFDHFFGE